MGLSAYSMIRMADGTEKRVEDLDAGDVVFDPIQGRSATVSSVSGGPGVGMTGIETATGRVLHLTGDHPVHTETGIVQAETIRRGNRLPGVDGLASCTDADALAGDFKVYDVRGEGLSGLLVNGLVVGV